MSNAFVRESDFSWEQGWITWANERKPDENSSDTRRGLTDAPTGEGAPQHEQRPGWTTHHQADPRMGFGGPARGEHDTRTDYPVQQLGEREADYPFNEEFAATQVIENALERLRRAVASPGGDVFHEFRRDVGDASNQLRVGRQPPGEEPPQHGFWTVPTFGVVLAGTLIGGWLGWRLHLRPRTQRGSRRLARLRGGR